MGKYTFNFRYRGPMDWPKIYKGTLGFFRERECEVGEPNYKDKTNEFEGVIKAERFVDMYTKFEFSVAFKAFDLTPTQKDGVYTGKLMINIEAENVENYEIANPGGKKVIFEEKSWLHEMYKKVTMRDREENIEGELIVTAQKYMEWLKEQCAMDSKYG